MKDPVLISGCPDCSAIGNFDLDKIQRSQVEHSHPKLSREVIIQSEKRHRWKMMRGFRKHNGEGRR